jgi:hypothetical protein
MQKHKDVQKCTKFNSGKNKIVARLGTMDEDKFHILIPKEFHEQIRSLKNK